MVERLRIYRETQDTNLFVVGIYDLSPKERAYVRSNREYQRLLRAYLDHYSRHVLDEGADPHSACGYAEETYYKREIQILVRNLDPKMNALGVEIETDADRLLKYAETFPKGVIRDGLIRCAKQLAKGTTLEATLRHILQDKKYDGAQEMISKNVEKALKR